MPRSRSSLLSCLAVAPCRAAAKVYRPVKVCLITALRSSGPFRFSRPASSELNRFSVFFGQVRFSAIVVSMTLARTLLCMRLSIVTGWLTVAVPESHARVQRVRHQPTVLRRHAVALQMCSDSLSAEFERRTRPVSQPSIVFGSPLDTMRQHKADGAYVLIFNRGQDDEGVYTMRGETPASCAGMHVLAFERREEASRYALLLQAQGLDRLAATLWESEPLADFCWRAEFGLGYVPHDAVLVPPQRNYVDAAALEKRQDDAFAKQQKSAGGVRHWSEQEAESTWSAGGSAVRTRTDTLIFDI